MLISVSLPKSEWSTLATLKPAMRSKLVDLQTLCMDIHADLGEMTTSNIDGICKMSKDQLDRIIFLISILTDLFLKKKLLTYHGDEKCPVA